MILGPYIAELEYISNKAFYIYDFSIYFSFPSD